MNSRSHKITASTNEFVHVPVLLQEAVQALEIKPEHWYIDATVGGGGHSRRIVESGGRVIGIDQDSRALEIAASNLDTWLKGGQVKLEKANFSQIDEVAGKLKETVSGALFDLGISSFQIQMPGRGFSFQHDEPLDMRMDPELQQVTAKDLVNGLYEKELTKLIETYGEDPLAYRISKSIVAQRRSKPIETTFELKAIIEALYHNRYSTKSTTHPATKTFQALRIAVNDEMNVLREGLTKTLSVIEKESPIVVISFHGLEDKTVKEIFQTWVTEGRGVQVTKKPIIPSDKEIEANPRSRSAKLRVFKKL